MRIEGSCRRQKTAESATCYCGGRAGRSTRLNRDTHRRVSFLFPISRLPVSFRSSSIFGALPRAALMCVCVCVCDNSFPSLLYFFFPIEAQLRFGRWRPTFFSFRSVEEEPINGTPIKSRSKNNNNNPPVLR